MSDEELRRDLRRVMIWAEREWPGNLERRMDEVLAVFREHTAPTDDEREALVKILATKRMHSNESLGRHGADADAILAAGFRRGAPTDDEAWVDDDLYGVIDRAMRRSWTDTAEYEYAPSEITAAVRAWMDEQCFRRGAPAEPAVTDEARQAAFNAAWGQFQRMPSSNPSDYAHAILRALSPLLNRVRAEARAEAFREAREAINHTRNVPSLITLADKFGGYHQGQRAGLEMAEGVIARIEQNSEGNET